MEKLRTLGQRAILYFLFFLCWFFAARWITERWDRGFWAFLCLASGAGAMSMLYIIRRGRRKAEEAAHLQRQLDVLRLAETEGGQLTATGAAVRLGWPLRVALATLGSLDDGVRVTTLVADDGVRLYEFPELIHLSGQRDRR